MNTSYKGKILISTPSISKDIFSRSVVLILEHDAEGAFGLILNKKASKNVNTSIAPEKPVFLGGPVELNKVTFLVKNEAPTHLEQIHQEYFFTPDIGIIIEGLLQKKMTPNDIKVFLGYSGWGARQLENEMKEKRWTVVENYIFDYTQSYNEQLWKSIMQNLGGEYLLWANAPEDLSMN